MSTSLFFFTVLEFNTVMKCKNAEKLFEFYSTHSKFFCLLPTEFDVKKLQYPSLLSVMDFSKQNVHILCPGASKYSLDYTFISPSVLKKESSYCHITFFIIVSVGGL